MTDSSSPPKVAVIIVSYNVAGYLRNCLISLRRSLANINSRVIVVDNNSRDGSPNMLRAEFPEHRLLETGRNIGFGRGINAGVELETAEYYLVLNPDTIVSGDIVEKMVAHLDANPPVAIAGCRMFSDDGSVQPCVYSLPSLFVATAGVFKLKNLLRVPIIGGAFRALAAWVGGNAYVCPEQCEGIKSVGFVPGSCFLIRGEVFRKLGGYDENIFLYYEDADLFYRVKHVAGGNIDLLPDIGVTHFVGKSFVMDYSDASPRKYWSMLYYFRKNSSVLSYYLIRLALLVSCGFRCVISKDPKVRADSEESFFLAVHGIESFNPFPEQ